MISTISSIFTHPRDSILADPPRPPKSKVLEMDDGFLDDYDDNMKAANFMQAGDTAYQLRTRLNNIE